MASRGANRLTRDNAGKITSVGGDGATARGGRLRTASGKQRGAVMAKVKGGAASSTIAKGGRGVRGSVARSVAAVRKDRAAGVTKPAVKVSFGREAHKRRWNRALTAPGIRAAYATQWGKQPSALEAKKIAKAKKTAERAQNWYSTSRRDGRQPAAAKPSRPSSKLIPRGQGAKVKRAKPAGTVVKPKGLKPGALAERRRVKVGKTAKAAPAKTKKKKATRPVTTPERQIVANQIRILRKKLKQDQKDSEKAMLRRASLGIGASRAATTTANARWARRAEERDKTIERIDALRERGRKLPRPRR